jgi:hypothetical protein
MRQGARPLNVISIMAQCNAGQWFAGLQSLKATNAHHQKPTIKGNNRQRAGGSPWS